MCEYKIYGDEKYEKVSHTTFSLFAGLNPSIPTALLVSNSEFHQITKILKNPNFHASNYAYQGDVQSTIDYINTLLHCHTSPCHSPVHHHHEVCHSPFHSPHHHDGCHSPHHDECRYLKGDKGNTGQTGADGPIGDAGPTGQSGWIYSVVSITNTDSVYTVDPTVYNYVSVNSGAGAVTVNLPNAPVQGTTVRVKDSAGSAATHNITVTTTGGVVNIDAATTNVISVNYTSRSYTFVTNHWEVSG